MESEEEIIRGLNKLRIEHLPMKVGCLLIALIWVFGFSAIALVAALIYILL